MKVLDLVIKILISIFVSFFAGILVISNSGVELGEHILARFISSDNRCILLWISSELIRFPLQSMVCLFIFSYYMYAKAKMKLQYDLKFISRPVTTVGEL